MHACRSTLEDPTIPEGSFGIDLAQVRTLADSIPGEKPKEIRFEQVAAMHVPSTAMVAGTGWAEGTLTFYSYQLIYPDQTVIIDATMDKKTADDTKAQDFNGEAFARVSKGLEQAAQIVITHEHYDHVGGIATHPGLAGLLPHLRLSKEQLSVPKKMDPLAFPADALKGYAPLEYDRLTAIAPGVVLIKAAGHTPGSQIVYVKRADGAEYLFLGDVAWHQQNVDEVRTRARLVTMMMGEDRSGVLLQLQELHRLVVAEPKLQVVPGHDRPRIEQLVAGGFLKSGFELR